MSNAESQRTLELCAIYTLSLRKESVLLTSASVMEKNTSGISNMDTYKD